MSWLRWKSDTSRGVDHILAALSRQIAMEIAILDPRDTGAVNSRASSGDLCGRASPAEIYALEIEAAGRLSDTELRIRIIAFRDLLQNLTTDDSYAKLSQAFIKDLQGASAKEMQEKLKAICARLYRRYSLVSAVESVRTVIAYKVLFASIALSVPFMFWLYDDLGPLSRIDFGYRLAMMCGAFGAGVSTIVRLYLVDTRHEPLVTWLALEKSSFSVFVAPILGATFALILTLILQAGIIDIDLFPDLEACWWQNLRFDPSQCNMPKLQKDDYSVGYLDRSKLALWSFIAGWAERFVPDALNRITDQGQATGTKR